MSHLLCPSCGDHNRLDANYCRKCGQPLGSSPKPASQAKPEQRSNWWGGIRKFLEEDIMGALLGTGGLANLPELKDAQRRKSLVALPKISSARRAQQNAMTARLPRLVQPMMPGETIGYFAILHTRPLHHSNYYGVRSLRCTECGHTNQTWTDKCCEKCQAELAVYLMRESVPGRQLSDERSQENIHELSRLSELGFLQHLLIFYQDAKQYIVLDHPAGLWKSLAQVALPVTHHELVTAWCMNLGQALIQLHEKSYIFYDSAMITDFLEPIVVVNDQLACFADLTSCRLVKPQAAVTSGQAPVSANTRQKDIHYIAQLLYTLTTGNRQNMLRTSGRQEKIPMPFQKVIERARGGQYADLTNMLDDLRQMPVAPEVTRGLRQIAGYATDVGQERDHNEDFVGKYSLGLEQAPGASEVGLYLVADGMGGHQAGEKASRAVVHKVVEQIHELQSVPRLKGVTRRLHQAATAGEILEQAVLQANQLLFDARVAAGSDRGTTITAALIVGESCTVANVGDSRTSLLRGGKLQQITTDHSLVASLVAAGMITHEEMRTHPQRNQIYRTLGNKPQVEVDTFTELLAPGDQLLLCSDGLWEMVPDTTIEKIMLQASNPQEACDQLIRAANAAGGEDNISVALVWLT